jgi:chromosome segregation ATPase
VADWSQPENVQKLATMTAEELSSLLNDLESQLHRAHVYIDKQRRLVEALIMERTSDEADYYDEYNRSLMGRLISQRMQNEEDQKQIKDLVRQIEHITSLSEVEGLPRILELEEELNSANGQVSAWRDMYEHESSRYDRLSGAAQELDEENDDLREENQRLRRGLEQAQNRILTLENRRGDLSPSLQPSVEKALEEPYTEPGD